jgi:hypothetical protein
MIYLLALIPATMLTIAGYFVIYLSHRSEGNFRSFGKYLGFWAITLAGLVILGSLFAAAHHGRGAIMGVYGRHLRMHGPWQGEPRFFRTLPGEPRDPGSEPPPPFPDGPPSPPPAEPAAPPPR